MGQVNELLMRAKARAEERQLPYAGALLPKEAAQLLTLLPHARLVDVRTKAEWDWVGRVPDALEIEWQSYPGGVPNTLFLDTLKASVSTDNMLFFMCRSGARSNAAATAASAAGFGQCYNVLEGFEGDKDANHHRNRSNGWRAAGLPWVQS